MKTEKPRSKSLTKEEFGTFSFRYSKPGCAKESRATKQVFDLKKYSKLSLN